MNPVAIVQDIYAAFGRGDISAILDPIAAAQGKDTKKIE